MIDGADLIRDANNNIDAEATLTNPRDDTATYSDPVSGEQMGGYYGAFIGAAPSTWPTLAPYISGRVNDDSTESKRVEFHRLPMAGHQAKVRFRFAQAGTASWYFGIDNFAIYSLPIDPLPKMTISRAGGKIVVAWPLGATGFVLETSRSMAPGSWLDVPGAIPAGDKMMAEITPAGPRAYFRLYK